MSRAGLAPLAALYGAGVAAKNLGFSRGWLRSRRLRWPVISIGNLSVGGSGKTPLTILLAELLAADGIQVDVLSRGYGRISPATEQVDPAGEAWRFGDEPLLIARRTGVPVYVGASRYQAGLLAEAALAAALRESAAPALGSPGPPKAVHLLDDGFQHRQLARDVDIVVVHRNDFGGLLLPAGRLREPMPALRRAHFVVLREEDADLEPKLRQTGIVAPVWRMRRSLQLPPMLAKGSHVVAFCGVAQPREFFAALAAAGCAPLQTVAFPDHHSYSAADVGKLAGIAAHDGADAFVTTEKDAVKLDSGLREVLEKAAPVFPLRLAVRLDDAGARIAELRENLHWPSLSPE